MKVAGRPSRRPASSLALGLALLAGGVLTRTAQGATVRFDSAIYQVEEGDADLRVALVIEAPECPGGGFQVLESTATIKARGGGTARAGEDFHPRAEEVSLGGSRHRIPHTLHGLLIDDRLAEGRETFRLTLELSSGAEVRCTATDEIVPLAPGVAATVEIEDGDTALPVLRLAIDSGDGQTGPPGQPLLQPLVVQVTGEDGTPIPRLSVSWQASPESAHLAAVETLTDGEGKARNQLTLGLEPGVVEVFARLGPEAEVVFHLRAVGPEAPIPPEDLCAHPERLPAAVRALCAQQPPDGSTPREILPDEVSAQGTMGIEGLRLQRGVISARMASIRGSAEGTGPHPAAGFLGAATGSGSGPTTSREAGFDYQLRCLVAGVDKELPHGVLVGGALSHTDGEVDPRADVGRLDTQTLAITLYGSYQAGLDAFHLDGIFTWGRQRFTMERATALRRLARSDPEGTVRALSLGGGSGLDLGSWRLEGYGYGHWAEAAIDPYEESGAGAFDLRLDGQRQRSLLAEAGLDVIYRKAFETWGVAIHFGGSAVRELADDSRRILFRFVEGPDPEQRFFVETEPPDRLYYSLEAGLTAKLPGPWAAYVNLQREVQRDDLETRSALAGVLFQF